MLKGAAMRIRQNSREVIEARKNPGIIHYTSYHKPWIHGTVHPYLSEFKKELAITPFRNWKPGNAPNKWWAPFTFQAFIRRGQFIFT